MGYDLTPFEIEMANFADRIEIIVGLEIGNKLSAEEAYKEIKLLMKDLKKSRKKYNKGADDNVVQR
jgi:hypothetical protein